MVHSWFSVFKNVHCFSYAIPLCCGTPDDPAVAPVEAGHGKGGRGGGGKGRRAPRDQSEVYEDIRVKFMKLRKKKMTST